MPFSTNTVFSALSVLLFFCDCAQPTVDSTSTIVTTTSQSSTIVPTTSAGTPDASTVEKSTSGNASSSETATTLSTDTTASVTESTAITSTIASGSTSESETSSTSFDPGEPDGEIDIEDAVLLGNGFKIVGATNGDRSGSSLISFHGWNNDTTPDVFLGADSPLMYAVFGGAQNSIVDLKTIDSSQEGVIVGGVLPFQRSLLNAGDWNGDGLDDVGIGEPSFGTNNSPEGQVYIVLGTEQPISVDVMALFQDGLASRISGTELGQRVGRSLGLSGDSNGDGKKDLILNAGDGRSAIVFGSSSSVDLTTENLAQGMGGYTIETCGNGFFLPFGDINSDGLDDHVEGGTANGGSICIVFGKQDTSTVLLEDIKSGTAGVLISPDGVYVSGDFFGYNAASQGDFNGDGYSDLIVTAPQSTYDRKAVIILGTSSWKSASLLELQGEGRLVFFQGLAAPGADLGFVSDLNSDGYDEVIISDNLLEPEVVWLVFGSAAVESINLMTLAVDKAGISLSAGGDIEFGASVSGATDLTGDGVPDLLLGAPDGSFLNRPYAGLTFVVDGNALVEWILSG